MKHIFDCTDEELLTFEILKEYKGYTVRIKPIVDKVKSRNFENESGKMVITNDTSIQRELHVLFQMFNGFEVDLGIVVQEIVEDDEHFQFFIKERLKYIGSFLINI